MKIAPHFKFHNLTLINAKSTLFQKIQHSYYIHREIIVYSQSNINAYSLLSHEWWVPLFMWEEGVRIYDTPKIPNNFPIFNWHLLTRNFNDYLLDELFILISNLKLYNDDHVLWCLFKRMFLAFYVQWCMG